MYGYAHACLHPLLCFLTIILISGCLHAWTFLGFTVMALRTGLFTGSKTFSADMTQEGFSLSSDCCLDSCKGMASYKSLGIEQYQVSLCDICRIPAQVKTNSTSASGCKYRICFLYFIIYFLCFICACVFAPMDMYMHVCAAPETRKEL